MLYCMLNGQLAVPQGSVSVHVFTSRGVVQLFNAVRQQQKTIDSEIKMVGSSERKKDKVMESMTKDKFLSILKGSRTNVKMEPSAEVM